MNSTFYGIIMIDEPVKRHPMDGSVKSAGIKTHRNGDPCAQRSACKKSSGITADDIMERRAYRCVAVNCFPCSIGSAVPYRGKITGRGRYWIFYEAVTSFFLKGLDLIGQNLKVPFFPFICGKACLQTEMGQKGLFFRQLFPYLG